MRGIALFLLMLSQAFAQEVPPETAGPQVQNNQGDYRIGPADVLAISILGLSEFTTNDTPSRIIHVSNSGKIHVPYLGVLTVTDMTTAQLESALARKLQEQDLVKEPQVQVRVAEYRGHNVYILGEVMMPGQYLLRETMYLTDLISLGMGFNEVASQHVYLYRHSLSPPKAQPPDSNNEVIPGQTSLDDAIKINIKELFAGTHPELNLQLQGGDILYCPQQRQESFYIVGDINKPGAMQIPSDGQLLCSQAVSMAGGPTRTAKMSRSILLRYDEAGVRQELAVDFDAILRGKRPDFAVQPNDIIFVPGSKAKTLGYGLLGVIPTIATVAAF